MALCRIRVQIPTRKGPLFSTVDHPSLLNQKLYISRTLIRMAETQAKPSRPICESCSKPTRLCLCSRIQNPRLDNSVRVTILQHSLESKHPLNSVRIVTLGLKNVNVATVSDVNFEARFIISIHNGRNRLRFDQFEEENKETQKKQEKGAAFTVTIGKHGVITSTSHQWMLQTNQHNVNFNELFTYPAAREDFAKGFMVKKLLQKRELEESEEEFEIWIPPKSVLLFPTEEAFCVDSLKASEFGVVENLIVLDGTWAKAKRMYNENPWLRFLPHLKLDLKEEVSLYGEVRHQPKVGCLSSIESIVYALKAIGNDSSNEGLDDLLDVFESMISDQRRCKDERLNKN